VLEGVLQLPQQRSLRVRHLPAARSFISRIIGIRLELDRVVSFGLHKRK
jgi:hypothetical protein